MQSFGFLFTTIKNIVDQKSGSKTLVYNQTYKPKRRLQDKKNTFTINVQLDSVLFVPTKNWS